MTDENPALQLHAALLNAPAPVRPDDPVAPSDPVAPPSLTAPRDPVGPPDPVRPADPPCPPGWRATVIEQCSPAAGDRPEKSSKEQQSKRWPWLLLLVPIAAAIALHNGSHHHSSSAHRTSRAIGAQQTIAVTAHSRGTAATPVKQASLAGVTLPGTGIGARPLHPLRLLLVLDSRSDLQRTDLKSVGTWLAAHERPGTVVRVVLASHGQNRLGPVQAPTSLSAQAPFADSSRRRAEHWLSRHGSRDARRPVRLAIAIGSRPPKLGVGRAKSASITLRAGAPVPSRDAADPRRENAIAAAIALQVIAATDQSETDPPHLESH